MQATNDNYQNFISPEMSLIRALRERSIDAAVVALGVFDGVHLGHRKLIGELKDLATKENAKVVALTFLPHPKAVVAPNDSPMLLISPEERNRLLLEAGADLVLTINFTASFAELAPEEFLDLIFEPEVGVIRSVGVGEKWKFGCRGSGNLDTLQNWCSIHHIRCLGVPELKINGRKVSASAIRKAVATGDLDLATKYLGRPYGISGIVRAGTHIAGTVLECPTANLEPENLLLPPGGVYAAMATVNGDSQSYPAAVNIGNAPTFRRHQFGKRVEAHLLGREGSLYGKEIRLELCTFIRPEIKFSTVDGLKNQIRKDLEEICRKMNITPPAN